MRDHGQHPEAETDSAPLNTALVMAALQSGNPKLRSLLVLYLEYVGTEHAKELISTLMARGDPVPNDLEDDIEEIGNNSQVCLYYSEHYDAFTTACKWSVMSVMHLQLHQLLHDCWAVAVCITMSVHVFIFGCFLKVFRRRRGSDWDENNSDYDVVADYSSRKSDVLTYPLHKAYLYGKKIGISKLYAQFAAGVFVGAADNGQKYKVMIMNMQVFLYNNITF